MEVSPGESERLAFSEIENTREATVGEARMRRSGEKGPLVVRSRVASDRLIAPVDNSVETFSFALSIARNFNVE